MNPCTLSVDSGWGLVCLVSFVIGCGLMGFAAVLKAWEYGERIREYRLCRLHGRPRE